MPVLGLGLTVVILDRNANVAIICKRIIWLSDYFTIAGVIMIAGLGGAKAFLGRDYSCNTHRDTGTGALFPLTPTDKSSAMLKAPQWSPVNSRNI
jgi:hypothetical protein